MEYGEEVADLVVDGVGIGEGAGDLLAEQGSIAGAEAMGGQPGRGLRATELGGHAGIRDLLDRAEQRRGLNVSNSAALAGGRHLRPQPIEDMVEQGRGPSTLEESFGGQLVSGLALIAVFGLQGVDRHEYPATTALQRPVAIAAVGEEVSSRRP